MKKNEIKLRVNDFLYRLIKLDEDESEDFASFFCSLPEADKKYCVQVFCILEQYHTGAITRIEAAKEYERLRKVDNVVG